MKPRRRAADLLVRVARRLDARSVPGSGLAALRPGLAQKGVAPSMKVAPENRTDLSEDLTRASFRRELVTMRRSISELRDIDPDREHPLRQLTYKLRNYRMAASHGVDVPTVYRSWSTLEALDLSDLPDTFVVKSDGGASARGVLPLRRVGRDAFTTVDGQRRLNEDEVRAHFHTQLERGKVLRPFFVEELLEQEGGGPIPDDVKIYACYGEVQQVLLRRVTSHGKQEAQTRRYLGPDGVDLGQVLPEFTVDETIPLPASLSQMMEIAAHLSRAVGVPFIRVDLYDSVRGPVLGELTRTPGGQQRVRADHDLVMGRGWERAAYRLDLDILHGRPPGLLHGHHLAVNHYPATHVSQSRHPGAWARPEVHCREWCGIEG